MWTSEGAHRSVRRQREMRKALVLALTGLGLTACVADDELTELDLDEAAQETVIPNGTSVNGTSINGTSINGTSINGTSINGTSINGTSINGLSVTGGQLTGTTSTGTPLSGAQMVGLTMNATTDTGATVVLKITGATQVASDLWAYSVVTVSGNTPLCGTGLQAFPFAGKWDYRSDIAGAGGFINDTTVFTWACRTKGAIAKCIDMGYAPWRIAGGVNLRNHHTACVRMMRGDYCGNGHAYTHDGTTINVYDGVGLQADTTAWKKDGEWNTAGAMCIKKETRAFDATPPCFATLSVTACPGFSKGALLIDEYNGL